MCRVGTSGVEGPTRPQLGAPCHQKVRTSQVILVMQGCFRADTGQFVRKNLAFGVLHWPRPVGLKPTAHEYLVHSICVKQVLCHKFISLNCPPQLQYRLCRESEPN